MALRPVQGFFMPFLQVFDVGNDELRSQVVVAEHLLEVVAVEKFLFQTEIQHLDGVCTVEACDFLTETAV